MGDIFFVLLSYILYFFYVTSIIFKLSISARTKALPVDRSGCKVQLK